MGYLGSKCLRDYVALVGLGCAGSMVGLGSLGPKGGCRSRAARVELESVENSV